jgi:hypothetical protein
MKAFVAEKRMRLILMLAALSAIVALFGCGGKKAAYSDIQTDSAGRAVNQNNSNQAAASPETAAAGSAESPASVGKPAQPEAASAPKVKIPSFLDMAGGGIKDVPTFPNSTRKNLQYGPVNGLDTMTLVLMTREKVESISAFYDKAAKSNGWTVVNSTHDPDLYELNLKKGDNNEAQVKAMKDSSSGMVQIVITRVEKPAEPKS